MPKKNLKMRVVVAPTPAVIAAAYDENGKADACTLAFYSPMEPLASVVERAVAFIEDIRHLPGNTLISTHAIAMKGLLEVLTPGSEGAYWSKCIGNCAVYAAENASWIIGIPYEIL